MIWVDLFKGGKFHDDISLDIVEVGSSSFWLRGGIIDVTGSSLIIVEGEESKKLYTNKMEELWTEKHRDET